MKRSHAQLKSELMARMEAEVDRLLEWTDDNPEPTFGQIEAIVLRCRQAMGQAMAQTVVEAQDKVQLAPGPRCPECGQEMRVKGRHRRHIESAVGDVPIGRCYYFCPRCRRGFFPPG